MSRTSGRPAMRSLPDLVHHLIDMARRESSKFDQPQLPHLLVRSVFMKHFGTLPGEPPMTYTRPMVQGCETDCETMIRSVWEKMERSTDEAEEHTETYLDSFIDLIHLGKPPYKVGTSDGDDLRNRVYDTSYDLVVSGLMYEAAMIVIPYIPSDDSGYPLMILGMCCALANKPFGGAGLMADECGRLLISNADTELAGTLILLATHKSVSAVSEELKRRKRTIEEVFAQSDELGSFFSILSSTMKSSFVLPLLPAIILGIPSDGTSIPAIPGVTQSEELLCVAKAGGETGLASDFLGGFAGLLSLTLLPTEYCDVLLGICPLIPGPTLLVACGIFLEKELNDDALRCLSLAYDVLGAQRVPVGYNRSPSPMGMWSGVLYGLELLARRRIENCSVSSLSDEELLQLAVVFAPHHPLTLYHLGKSYHRCFPLANVMLEFLSRDKRYLKAIKGP